MWKILILAHLLVAATSHSVYKEHVADIELRDIQVTHEQMCAEFNIIGPNGWMPEVAVSSLGQEMFFRYNDTPDKFSDMEPGDLFVRVDGCGDGYDVDCWETMRFSTKGGRLRLVDDAYHEDWRNVGGARHTTIMDVVAKLKRKLAKPNTEL